MISRAVPGDILVIGGRHVVIIQNLRYPEGSLITAYDQIDVIHATSGGTDTPNVWQVQKDTFASMDTAAQRLNYQLRRYNR
jgi:ribosome-associated translation inhibitor RaiA